MVLCVVYLTEASRRFLAKVIAFSCCILTLFALTFGLLAYSNRAKFSDHVMHLFLQSPAKTRYLLHSFKKSVWMAAGIFFWCLIIGLASFINAGSRQRWSEGKMKLLSCVIDLISLLSLLASLAAFFVNFFAVAELEASLYTPLRFMFSMYGNETADHLYRHRVDYMQYELQCCGLFHWSEWLLPPLALDKLTIKLADLDQRILQADYCNGKMYCYVPWTCCRRNSTEVDCLYRSNIGRTLLDPERAGMNYHPTGCYVLLSDHFSSFLRTSSLFWIGMFGCQLVIFLSWRLLSTSIKSWYQLQLDTIVDKKHPAIAPGWIVPCCGYPAGVYLGEDNEKVDQETWGVGFPDKDDEDGGTASEGEEGGAGEAGGDGAGGRDKKKKGKKKKEKKSKTHKKGKAGKRRMKRRGRRGGKARMRMRRR